LSKSNTINWLSKVKALLQSAGFNDVWMYPESVKLNIFKPVLHGRLKDIYITNWHSSVHICSSLYLYKHIKTDLADLTTWILLTQCNKEIY
jgi:hypothetical protein